MADIEPQFLLFALGGGSGVRLLPDHLVAPRHFLPELGQKLAEAGLSGGADEAGFCGGKGIQLALSGLQGLEVAIVGAGKESERHRMGWSVT